MLLASVLIILVPATLDAADRPEFRDGRCERVFDTAVDLFEKERYDDARKRFESCVKRTDSKGRKILNKWVSACDSGERLLRIEKQLSSDNLRESYKRVKKLQRSEKKGPLSRHIDRALRDMESQLFVALATYEHKSPKAEAALDGRRGGHMNRVGKYVRSGRGSARWEAEPGSHGRLRIARFKGELFKNYKTLHASIYLEGKTPARVTFCLTGSNKMLVQDSKTKMPAHCYTMTVELKPGWNDLDLQVKKSFERTGDIQLDEVSMLTLVYEGSGARTMFIDDVRLEIP